jgi:hypothetical protein
MGRPRRIWRKPSSDGNSTPSRLRAGASASSTSARTSRPPSFPRTAPPLVGPTLLHPAGHVQPQWEHRGAATRVPVRSGGGAAPSTLARLSGYKSGLSRNNDLSRHPKTPPLGGGVFGLDHGVGHYCSLWSIPQLVVADSEAQGVSRLTRGLWQIVTVVSARKTALPLWCRLHA